DVTVVDQHLVTRAQHLADGRGRDRELAGLAVRADDNGDAVAGRQLHRPREVADADLRPLQVADQGDRPARALLRFAHERRADTVVVMGAVRKIEPRGVHARRDERVELLGRRGCRPDRGDDLRSPRTDGGHEGNLASAQAVLRKAVQPGYGASPPSSSSIRSSWLYFATRSVRDGAPVLICPTPVETARSAIVVSSVSPERCDITHPYPCERASSIVSSVSVSVPIWLTLGRIAFATPSSRPRWSRSTFVTKRSSPTSCSRDPSSRVSSSHPRQSSSASPSSTDTSGERAARPSYSSIIPAASRVPPCRSKW